MSYISFVDITNTELYLLYNIAVYLFPVNLLSDICFK